MPMNFTRTAFLLLALMALFVAVGAALGGKTGLVLAFFVALATNVLTLWKSDKLVLRMHKAQEVDAASGGQYYGIVRQMAANAELPMPKVFVLNTPQPNAFATGRNPENAAVAASTGLLELLSAEEVAGVIAHELAHIKSRDTLTMTAAATIGGAVSMVAQYLQFGALFGRRDSRTSWPAFLFAALVAPFAAMMIQMAISRSREYQADRLGALICRDPRWLASGLRKIDLVARRMRNPTAEAHPASAHLFIVNPLTGRGIDSFFSTHPNVENRIQELEKLTQEMAAAGQLGPDTMADAGSVSGPSILTDGAPWLDKGKRDGRGAGGDGRGPWG